MAEETKAELPPGRELDKRVAEEVFGYEVITFAREFYYDEIALKLVPEYSTDIAAAWQVLEQFQAKYILDITSTAPDLWYCTFYGGPRLGVNVSGLTGPHAICLAALKAKAKEKAKEQHQTNDKAN